MSAISIDVTLVWLFPFRPPDLPGPPSAPEAEDIFHDHLTLTWSAPDHDGGTPITGYFIERSTAKRENFIRITRNPVEERTFEVRDLIQDNDYKFRIVAVNKVGEGPPGPSSRPITAKDPWGK